MADKLHIDVETYSSVDIKTSGAYKYMESPDFEVLMVAFALNEEPVQIVDLARGETLPLEFILLLNDPDVEKWAHNAAFERNAFRAIGYDIPATQWHCTAVKSAMCGLPMSLEMVSKVLELQEKGKLSTGKALIKYFCIPCAATKTNNGRRRNLPVHDIEKWDAFKVYCVNDVEAEREIDHRLDAYDVPLTERENYVLDQLINDRGLRIDLDLANLAVTMDARFKADTMRELKQLTGLSNPNSDAQLKVWLSAEMQTDIDSLAKGNMDTLTDLAGSGAAGKALELRTKLKKTSVKKYTAMLAAVCDDMHLRGLLQFYGAGRTGRWAGRIVQPHNLPKNDMEGLDMARQAILSGDYQFVTMMYDSIPEVLSQLIRTAFIADEGSTFGVADFSAIEGRVIAWLAYEQWRMDIFAGHGKIYEESAARMFGIPIESVTKGSKHRSIGKIAELALGFQGGINALKTMETAKRTSLDMTDEQMQDVVTKWREASPQIGKLWRNIEACAINAVKTGKPVTSRFRGIVFDYDGTVMTIKLPSGRKLHYWKPQLYPGKFGGESLRYWGMNQTTRQWEQIYTYGGKIVENIVQAIARDALADNMRRLDNCGFDIRLHVHDEVVVNIPLVPGYECVPDMWLEDVCGNMGLPLDWAPDLLLTAEGYLTDYYKKD